VLARLSAIAIACLLWVAPPPAVSAEGRVATVTVRHDGLKRTALVRIPPQVAEQRPLPLVLNFHGGAGNAVTEQRYVRMDALADREGFILVYPNGTGVLEDRLLTWNAGTCCGLAARENVDDVGFVRALLDELARRLPVDSSRVYATGLSNGAMMSYRLAAELSDRIAAIAPVAGASAMPRFHAKRMVPILHVHSVDDPRALYKGGLGPPFPFTNVRVMHQPVEEVLSHWAAFGGCNPKAVLREERRGTAGTPSAEHTAKLYVYTGCRDGTEVALWQLTGVGHVWPGAEPNFLPRLLGPGTDVIDANEEIWRFFRGYHLPPARQ
jgi:polyhydroxybutyrate depolymerase